MFDNYDVYVKPFIQALEEEIVNCNLWTNSDPKFVKVSKVLPYKQRKKHVNLMIEYSNVFDGSMRIWRHMTKHHTT